MEKSLQTIFFNFNDLQKQVISYYDAQDADVNFKLRLANSLYSIEYYYFLDCCSIGSIAETESSKNRY